MSKNLKEQLEQLYNFKISDEIKKIEEKLTRSKVNIQDEETTAETPAQDLSKNKRNLKPKLKPKKATDVDYADNSADNNGSSAEDLWSSVKKIPINLIKPNPYQPRKEFNKDKIDSLAASIASHGLLSPILVRKYSQGYYIIAGERRYRAVKQNQSETIEALELNISDEQMQNLSLIENIQREDLNDLEKAIAFNSILQTQKITQEELAKSLNISRSSVTNTLSLLRLPKDIQNAVLSNKLSAGHAKVLVNINDQRTLHKIAQKAIDKNLSVRNVENIVRGYKLHNMPKNRKKIATPLEYQDLANYLMNHFHAKVVINKRKITLSFRDDKHLVVIARKLGFEEDSY